jgi:hypothetical protein
MRIALLMLLLVARCAGLCAPPGSALRRLALTADTTTSVVRNNAATSLDQSASPKHSNHEAIYETLRTSRERSYEQGRQGCCGKARDYLGGGGPPPGSPWARNSL